MTSRAQRSKRPPCDLVMKGGVTSGVVYPPVIVELAEKHEFVSIGGTSAGAIAATMTAAAEYGRKREHLETFADLNGLSDELSRPGALLGLFRAGAPAELRPLLDTLLPLVSDPGAATDTPVAHPAPVGVPPLLRRLAPELIDLVLPPRPDGAPPPDDRLGKTLSGLLLALPEHHTRAYQAGAAAGGQAGVRVGQYLIYAAVLLGLIFALPLLLAGAAWPAWIAWALLAALLVGAAYWAGQQLGRSAMSAGGTLVALRDLGRLLFEGVPANLYGICSGLRQPDVPDDEPALTDWLDRWVEHMAGPTPHGGPLTFSDLQSEEIQLQMVTTNLSHARPYILPFASDFTLLFQRADMQRLLPHDILTYMCQDQHLYPGWSLDDLNAGLAADDPKRFYMLPNSEDLPVLLAMRMSLSFPLLISAVRLYTVSADCPRPEGMYRPRREHLQENWFSDGGICSNFPIHFFDNWLPTHPTFGINLTALPRDAFQPEAAGRTARPGAKGEPPVSAPVQPGFVSQIAPEPPLSLLPQVAAAEQEQFLRSALLGPKSAEEVAPPRGDQAARVLLPDAEQPVAPLWRPVESLTRFLWSMFDTAMNYRDTTQLMLPSYKERAVQIRLDGTREGGLNLNMPEETVRKLQRYGREAGALLRDQFDFDRHRWVRFRVLMGELERQLLSLDEPLGALASQSELTVYEQIMQMARAAMFPFGDIAQPSWVAAADTRLRMLRTLISAWRDANRDAQQDDGQGEQRMKDLSRVMLALTDLWRRSDLTPEQSDRQTQEILALVEGWGSERAELPRYVGREVRFFKPVAGAGLELRVTPEL